MATAPVSESPEAIRHRVESLLAEWRRDTAFLSSSTQITGHRAYRELIALGPAALPALFGDLERTRDGHLAKALTAITGVNPIPDDARGKISQIADIWLAWAKSNGQKC